MGKRKGSQRILVGRLRDRDHLEYLVVGKKVK
jgi:hypothetical protein